MPTITGRLSGARFDYTDDVSVAFEMRDVERGETLPCSSWNSTELVCVTRVIFIDRFNQRCAPTDLVSCVASTLPTNLQWGSAHLPPLRVRSKFFLVFFSVISVISVSTPLSTQPIDRAFVTTL